MTDNNNNNEQICPVILLDREYQVYHDERLIIVVIKIMLFTDKN